MTYKVTAIYAKARRTGWGQDYIDDCKALADEWNEAEDRAVFSDDAVAEIKATWSVPNETRPTQRKPCKGCRGL